MKNLSPLVLEDLKRKRQKATKSYAERMRRNRINKYLEELKVTVLGSGYENVKMEQAAILEFSVEYLKCLKYQLNQMPAREAPNPERTLSQPSQYIPTENDENSAANHSRNLKRKLSEDPEKDFAGSPDFSGTINPKRRKLAKAKRLSFGNTVKAEPGEQSCSLPLQERLVQIPLSNSTINRSNNATPSDVTENSTVRTAFQDLSKTMHNNANKFWRPW